MEYSEKFKARMVAKMVGSHAVSGSTLATEVGLSQPTLSRDQRGNAPEEIVDAGQRAFEEDGLARLPATIASLEP